LDEGVGVFGANPEAEEEGEEEEDVAGERKRYEGPQEGALGVQEAAIHVGGHANAQGFRWAGGAFGGVR